MTVRQHQCTGGRPANRHDVRVRKDPFPVQLAASGDHELWHLPGLLADPARVGSLVAGEHHGDVVRSPVALRQCHQIRTGGLDVCSPLHNALSNRSLFNHIGQPIGAEQ